MTDNDSAPSEKVQAERIERLSAIGHDIRTPLHSILGFSQLISTGDATLENVRRWAELITVSGVELGLMIESLLRLGAIEANAAASALGPVDLCGVLDDVASLLVGAADASGKAVRLEFPSLRPLVQANQRDLVDAFARLVHNAIKHSSGAEIVISVSPPSHRTSATEMVTTTISDNGLGFEPEQFSEFAKRFTRGPAVAGVGLGLGLAIADHLIASGNGTLGYRNDEAQPSTFVVSLQPVVVTKGSDA